MLYKATLKDGDPMNVLEHLEELRGLIQQYGVRLVVIDGQNSVVGAPCIATDMLARHNVTNKLHQFAQKENICLVGIRNEDAEGRAYGPASMNDLGRFIMRSVELENSDKYGQRYFELVFDRVSDSAPETYRPIPFSVENLGGSSRRILWGKRDPTAAPAPEGETRETILPTGLLKGAGDRARTKPIDWERGGRRRGPSGRRTR
jgi:hypothetical protein